MRYQNIERRKEMKKLVSTLLLMLSLIISGCSNKEIVEHHYTYSGANESWHVEYKVDDIVTFTENNGKLDTTSKKDNLLTATYKKNLSDLSEVKKLSISYEYSDGGGSLSENYDEGPPTNTIFTIKSGSTGGAVETEQESIQVTITIDGKEQVLDLKINE